MGSKCVLRHFEHNFFLYFVYFYFIYFILTDNNYSTIHHIIVIITVGLIQYLQQMYA